MVPMRTIFEALGAEVSWDEKNQFASATKGVDSILFTIGYNYINDISFGSRTGCEVAPKIVNNRTFVPLRAIADSLDYNVSWNESNRTVYIDEKSSPIEYSYEKETITLDTAHDMVKIVVNYTYPKVTGGNDFIKAEDVSKLNEIITSQRTSIVDIYSYAANFADEYFVIIEDQTFGYPNITLDITTKIYTSEKYGTISLLTGVEMPWIGAEMTFETLGKDDFEKKEFHQCFSDKGPQLLYSEIFDEYIKNFEDVRYGKEELEEIPGIVPVTISDNDLRIYMSHISLTGVGRVNSFFTAIKKY